MLFFVKSLVPHDEHDHDDPEAAKDDQQALFRAFIVFLGVYIFFLVECIMKLKLAIRKKSDKRVSVTNCCDFIVIFIQSDHNISRNLIGRANSDVIVTCLMCLSHFKDCVIFEQCSWYSKSPKI